MLVRFQRNVQCIITRYVAPMILLLLLLLYLILTPDLSLVNTEVSEGQALRRCEKVWSCFLLPFHVTLPLERIPLTP
jgi:hypothetical protein